MLDDSHIDRIEPLDIAVAGATTKRIHRGRVNSAEEHFMLASQEVLTEADRTFLTELQETVRSATDEEQFSQIVTLMQSAKHARHCKA